MKDAFFGQKLSFLDKEFEWACYRFFLMIIPNKAKKSGLNNERRHDDFYSDLQDNKKEAEGKKIYKNP